MIGIFDSGIGGFSVYKSIKKLLPSEDFIYVADKKFFPYGTKPTKVVRERSEKIISWLEERGVKLIVIACNTSTVSSLRYLRTLYPTIPIVGTVPVIKTCAKQSKTGKIGVLCTAKTANSAYQKNLILKFTSNNDVSIVTCSNLVETIEENNLSKNYGVLKKPLKRLLEKNIDTLALGCTHFALVSDSIKELMGKDVLVLHSGDAIARQVKKVLKNNKNLCINNKQGKTCFYTTAYSKKFDIMISKYINLNTKSKLISI